MAWTIEKAVSDPLLRDVRVSDNLYSFRIGELPQIVTVELGKRRKLGRFRWKQSHVLHTPLQAGGYRTSEPSANDRAYA